MIYDIDDAVYDLKQIVTLDSFDKQYMYERFLRFLREKTEGDGAASTTIKVLEKEVSSLGDEVNDLEQNIEDLTGGLENAKEIIQEALDELNKMNMITDADGRANLLNHKLNKAIAKINRVL